jgi:Fanconi anemia group D2 protein
MHRIVRKRRRMGAETMKVTHSQGYFDMSQFSQSPDDLDGGGGGGGSGKVGEGGDDVDGTTIRIVSESSSLLGALLGVDALQPTILAALLGKLTSIASSMSSSSMSGDGENYDEDRGSGRRSSNDDGNENENEDDVPRLILSNVRWLDHVVDHGTLIDSYVECLTVLSSSSGTCDVTRGILLDALTALPDVLGDSMSHNRHVRIRVKGDGDDVDEYEEDDGGNKDGNDNGGEVGGTDDDPILSTLQYLRAQDPSLLVPCLDAIGSLPLSSERLVSATRDALEALTNVDRSGLPALTTFLMTRCPVGGGIAMEVIEGMRNLPLGGEDDDGASSSSASSCLVIESLSRGFAHRPDMTSALLRSVKATPNDGGRHPPADIWLLACCAFAPHNRQKVKSIFKSKANAGAFTSSLLRESLSGNGVALTCLFGTSLCDLADALLRSPSSSEGGGGGGANELGVTMYELLFEIFREPMQRQEVVGSLVTHVGSGVSVKSSEVDAALRAFCGIVNTKDGAAALRPFTPFLTSMLDHLHNMTPSQVRRLFLLLFAVGGSDGDGNDPMGSDTRRAGGTCDDVHIVIRKHLSLAPFAMKRIVSRRVLSSLEILERMPRTHVRFCYRLL